MKKEMEIWDGNECDYDTHVEYINKAYNYMKKNKNATQYYTTSGDTFVFATRDEGSDYFEIYDMIIRRSGIFKN